jgi:hypothetical protein
MRVAARLAQAYDCVGRIVKPRSWTLTDARLHARLWKNAGKSAFAMIWRQLQSR